jgi:NTE family protein
MWQKIIWGCAAGIVFLFSQTIQAKVIRLEYAASSSPWEDFGGRKVIIHPSLGLALSGGGARGFAHIGVLKVLEREKIPIAGIAGTSMGGAVGGLYAAGYSANELEEIVLNQNWQDIFSDTPPRLSLLQPQREEAEGVLFEIHWDGFKPEIPSGLTSAQKLTNLFTDLTFKAGYFSDSDFDQLRIPFHAITTDLISGEKVVLDSGELALALRATIAVPLAVTPLAQAGKLLVDGGLVDPVPVDEVKKIGADRVIAVNTSSTLLPEEKIKDPLDIATQSVSIMSLEQKNKSLKLADLVIEPDLTGFSATDFTTADTLITLGEKIADSLLPQIKRLLESDSTPKYLVKQIEFAGNQAISEDSLIAWAGLACPGKVSEKQIYQALADLYERGYFPEVYAEIDSNNSETYLTIYLQENPLVKEIVVQNNSTPSQVLAQKAWGNPHARILNFQECEKFLEKELSKLQQKGSSLARLVSLEYLPESQRLVASLEEGKIAEINLKGNQQTKDWLVYSNFPLKKGDPFNLKLAQKGLTNLQSCGYFDQVNLAVTNSAKGAVLNLSLAERKFVLTRGGIHWWDEYDLEGFLEIGHMNLRGTGNQLYARAFYGNRRENYFLRLKANRILRTYLTYQLSLYYRSEDNFLFSRHEKIGEFKEIRRGGKFSLGQNLARLGKVSVELQAERISFENRVTAEMTSENKRSLLFQILFDNLDRYPYPQKGNYNQLSLEIASHWLGGEVAYRKFQGSLETYLPLTEKLNFHPSLRLGYADRKLPLYEKFNLGGKESFYGLHSEEKRGNKLGEASLELRLKSARRFFWFLRYDIGDTWEDQVEIRRVIQGVGLKLGITTPLGPIELGYGYNSLRFDKFYLTWGYQF